MRDVDGVLVAHMRRPESVANYSLSLLELVALLATLSPARVGGLLLLQIFIVVGFWTGVLDNLERALADRSPRRKK